MQGKRSVGRLVCTVVGTAEGDPFVTPDESDPYLRIDDLTVDREARKNLGTLRMTTKHIRSLADAAGVRFIAMSAITSPSRILGDRLVEAHIAEKRGAFGYIIPLERLDDRTLLRTE